MEQEVKAEFDGFIGIFENAYDKQYIKELIQFFETSSDLTLVQKSSELQYNMSENIMLNISFKFYGIK